jgi:hypothetical protein
VEEYKTVVLGSGAAIVLIVVVAIVVAFVRRRRRARAMQAPLPLIPFSASHGSAFGPPRPDRSMRSSSATPADRASAPTPVWTPPVADGLSSAPPRSPYAPPSSPELGRGAVARASGSSQPGSSQSRSPQALPNDDVADVEGTAIEGASVRYWRPADGTLQFLPGRLEVVAGRDSGQEIRFVRTPGPDGTRVTFGRADGAPYRHVQLREPTVSRTHARMTLETVNSNGPEAPTNTPRWRLENLSATNPVVVNGTPLASDESELRSVVLDDGDRIEMGEVVFRFHER